MVFLSGIFGASYMSENKFWPIFRIVLLVYITAGIAGWELGKHDAPPASAWVVGLMISLIGIRWIEIVRRRP
jgi:uncharacterized membrane protein YfcA